MSSIPDDLKDNIYSFIDGNYLASEDIVANKQNPATRKPLYNLYQVNQKQLQLALKAGDEAAKNNKQLSPAQRSQALLELANLIEKNQDAFVSIEVEDTGRPIKEILEYDLPSAIDCLKYYAKLILELSTNKYDSAQSCGYVKLEPYGLCLGIGAWNYPLQISIWKLAPALAAGNSMILKPSELTPRSSLLLAQLTKQTSFPKATVQTIVGDGTIGAQLILAKEVKKVSITGSVETGRKVAALSGKELKPITAELGGKSPLIMVEPFDIKNAVQLAMLANFYSAGQVCTNGTRVFVPKAKKTEFLEQVLAETSKIQIGDPFDPQTSMGPVISKTQFDKVQNFITLGEKEGAKKHQPLSPPSALNGYYISPTIFSECTDEMTITNKEIFGPVMSVLTYDSVEEVITRANQLDVGLAAGVICNDLALGESICSQLEAGVCWLNTYNETPIELPFGGTKDSGIGRENGLQGLLSYTQTKTILISKNSKTSFMN